MKKSFTYLYLLIFSFSLSAQPITFIKKVTNNNLDNWSYKIVEGQNGHYYLAKTAFLYGTDYSWSMIMQLDEWGNKIDSIITDTLLNMKNYANASLSKLKNNILYFSTIGDSLHHYFYIRVFDQNLQTVIEKIVDTLPPDQSVAYHIENKKGNHVFLSFIVDSLNSYWDMLLTETDSNFNLLKKVDLNFKDVYYWTSFVDVPSDSSYLISTRNWIVRIDNNFSHLDTVVNCFLAGENTSFWKRTKKYNDSLYFESNITGADWNSSLYNEYPGFYVRTKNATKIDTFTFQISSEKNDVTQAIDFMDFISPDTLFYCSGAFSKDITSPENSGIMLAKFNMDKTIYWQKFFGFDGNYHFSSVTATQDGGCVLLCQVYDWVLHPTDNNVHNLVLIKTDKYGNAPTGMEESIKVNDKQILVYPNPVVSMMHFQTGLYDKLELKIYNINGQLQIEKKLSQGDNSIDVSRYANGIYFYRIINLDKFLENGKFVKE
jgi:hypothetical protein